MKLVIWGPNVAFADGVTFHVHAEGCADLKKAPYRHLRAQSDMGGWVEDHDTIQSCVEEMYSNQIEESDGKWDEVYVDDFHFFPCVTIPRTADTAEDELDDTTECSYEQGHCATHNVRQLPVPFGQKYQERTAKGSSGKECCICGRQTADNENTKLARVTGGGGVFSLPGEQVDERGDMGYFPVGSECAKLLPAEYFEVSLDDTTEVSRVNELEDTGSRYTPVSVRELKDGDKLVNLGTVERIMSAGAFVWVEYTSVLSELNVIDGTVKYPVVVRSFHSSEEVVLDLA